MNRQDAKWLLGWSLGVPLALTVAVSLLGIAPRYSMLQPPAMLCGLLAGAATRLLALNRLQRSYVLLSGSIVFSAASLFLGFLAVMFGFHETDTLWFTGSKSSFYYVHKEAPETRRAQWEAGVFQSSLERLLGSDVASDVGHGTIFVHGGWREHADVRRAIKEIENADAH